MLKAKTVISELYFAIRVLDDSEQAEKPYERLIPRLRIWFELVGWIEILVIEHDKSRDGRSFVHSSDGMRRREIAGIVRGSVACTCL